MPTLKEAPWQANYDSTDLGDVVSALEGVQDAAHFQG
jgi:hypothetical protein